MLKGFYWLWLHNVPQATTFITEATAKELASTQGTPSPYIDLELPDDFPNQILIWRAFIGCGNSSLSDAGEMHLWVDPGGRYFHGSVPPGQEEGNPHHTDLITIARIGHVPALYQPQDEVNLPRPILFDRAAKDKLSFFIAPSAAYDWIFMNIEYESSAHA